MQPNAYGYQNRGLAEPVAVGVLLPEGQAGAGEPAVWQYMLWLTLVGVPLGIITMAAYLADALYIPMILGGVALTALVLWRVEMGIFVMAGLIAWEVHTRFGATFSLVKAVGIVVASLGLLRVFVTRGERWPTMLKFVLVMAVWLIVSSLFNIRPPLQRGLLTLASILSNFMFLYLVWRFCSKRAAFVTLVLVLVLSSVGAAVVGILMYGGTRVAGEAAGATARLTTAEGLNINTYVRLMFPGIFMTPILMIQTRSKALRLLLIPLMAICLTAAILTVSRAAVGGIAVGGIVMLLLQKRIGVGTKVLIVVLVAILATFSAYAAGRLGADEPWQKRLATAPEGLETRTRRWVALIKPGIENPVFGVGYGYELAEFVRLGWGPAESHNDLISVAFMTGIPGLLIYLGILFFWFWGLWRMPGGVIRSSLLSVFTALFLTGLFNPSLNKKIFWLTAGISAAAVTVSRTGAHGEPQPREPRPAAPSSPPQGFG